MASGVGRQSAAPLGLSPSGSLTLPPALTVPPTLHPNALSELSLCVTQSAVLIKSASSSSASKSYASVGWGMSATVSNVIPSAVIPPPSWSNACTIYGIIGIVKLFQSTYLLVISSRQEVGDLLGKTIYTVRAVTPIPLNFVGATAAVRSHIARQSKAKMDPSKEPILESSDVVSDDEYPSSMTSGDDTNELGEGSSNVSGSPLPGSNGPSLDSTVINDVLNVSPSQSSDVGEVAPLSESAGVRRLTQRLAFWNRKQAADSAPTSVPASRSPSAGSIPAPQKLKLNPTGVLELLPPSPPPVVASLPAEPTEDFKRSQLEAKILREVVRLFSHEMYMAYDFDITASIQRKTEKIAGRDRSDKLLHDLAGSPQDEQGPSSTAAGDSSASSWIPHAERFSHLPLWRRVDRRFWWNEELMQPFVNAGLHEFVLPVMQGFVQMTSFSIPSPAASFVRPSTVDDVARPAEVEEPEDIEVDYVIISRRSRQRAGLRYQRRGIDEDANVANFVETEAITCLELEQRLNVFSHIQIRGSMPLFWSQPGVHLKPAPKLDRTPSESLLAMRKHFDRSVRLYGPHTIVSLSEITGKEAAVTNAYSDLVSEMARSDVTYQGFDFHNECKGMKYENILKLITALERTFEHQGFFWASGPDVLSQQNGVYRVNCIDCLDRTNVVESAFARHVLVQQLQACALVPTPEVRREMEVVFNDVWANNGDAVSRAYAGTSALKGDFTRTGKRDIGGMLNDGMNSLARMYTATFSDYFTQAVIDYALGHRGLSVFSEFMLNMSTTDPRELFRLSKIRAIAIETCAQLVVLEGEEVLPGCGWTLFSPVKPNTRVADMFEEKVLLLTNEALYIISYDYTLEKVRVVTRVPLTAVVSIQKGAYILSPLQDAGRDPEQNYGFLLRYKPTDQVITRVTSYSVNNRAMSMSMAPVYEDDQDPLTGTPAKPQSPAYTSRDSAGTIRPTPVRPTHSHKRSTSSTMSTSSTGSNATATKAKRAPGRSLSKLLSSTALVPLPLPLGSKSGTKGGEEDVYVAFKALPVDYTIQEREARLQSVNANANVSATDRDGSGGASISDPLSGASPGSASGYGYGYDSDSTKGFTQPRRAGTGMGMGILAPDHGDGDGDGSAVLGLGLGVGHAGSANTANYPGSGPGSSSGSKDFFAAGGSRQQKTCREVVDGICTRIAESVADARVPRSRGIHTNNGTRSDDGNSKLALGDLRVEKDIVSLEEARRSTPVFGKAEYALKRLLWLGS